MAFSSNDELEAKIEAMSFTLLDKNEITLGTFIIVDNEYFNAIQYLAIYLPELKQNFFF